MITVDLNFLLQFSPAVLREREIGKGCDAFQRISVPGMGMGGDKASFSLCLLNSACSFSSTLVRVHLGLTGLN
jgi:hypothetical protein